MKCITGMEQVTNSTLRHTAHKYLQNIGKTQCEETGKTNKMQQLDVYY
jgi:hypothetical protein